MKSLTKQIGGDHYKKMTIQPAEFINKNKLLFAEGNAIKYIVRAKDKGGKEDLLKAKHYIDMIIERDYGDEAEKSKIFDGDVKVSYDNNQIFYPSGVSVGQEGFDE